MENQVFVEIGKRIRRERLRAGMTQARLCDGYITRNMLSRIETGDAHPSLDTLLYIAKKLKLPPAFLLCTDLSEEQQYKKILSVQEIRRLISAERFEKCTSVIKSSDAADDEIYLALSLCKMCLALTSLKSGRIKEALQYLDKASQAVHETVYLREKFEGEIRLLRSLCGFMLGDPFPLPDVVAACGCILLSGEIYLYITALSLCENGIIEGLSISHAISESSIYKSYLESKRLVCEKKYTEAINSLYEIVEYSNDALTSLCAMRDLEICCRESGDFKSAYEISKEYTRLISEAKNA